MSTIPWLQEQSLWFPPTSQALDDPNGLLAAGGDLRPERILSAYQRGIFPWFSEGDPILWWSPNPRCIVVPLEAYQSKSLAKLMRKPTYRVTFDQAFDRVIHLCGETRRHEGTWITDELKQAYCQLAAQGFGHSVEVWRNDLLVGGLYGLAFDQAFFGESMFSLEPNTSKIAFIALARRLTELDIRIIDCQVTSDHLLSLGAKEISRIQFESLISAETADTRTPTPIALI